MRQIGICNLHRPVWSTVDALCNYAESIGVVPVVLGSALTLKGVLDGASSGRERQESRDVEQEIHFELNECAAG
jgi:hypothetical protein